MEDFVKVATISEIPEKTLKAFVVEGQDILIAHINGKFYAIANECTHDGQELGDSDVINENQVECPRHGARFDVTTGNVKALPATQPIQTYETQVLDDCVYIKLT